MPNYGVIQAGEPGQNNLTAIQPGDKINLFDDELPVAGQASMAVTVGYSPGGGPPAPILFTIVWAVAPTAVVVIQGANEDIDGEYQTLFTSTNKQTDFYYDAGSFAYYRAKLVSVSAGTSLEVVAKR